MKISIITATLNSGHFIESCILSILRQNVKDLEIIIIDGLSTDSTHSKLRPLINQNDNIQFYSEKDLGIYDALNKGIEKATGEIIGFVHSDDMLADDDILNTILESFKNNNIDGIYGDLEYVEKINVKKTIRYWQSCTFNHKLLKKGWALPHPTLYLKKSVYEKHGLFDLDYTIAADYEFMIRIFSDKKFEVSISTKTYIENEIGGVSNKNLKNILLKSQEDYNAIKRIKLVICLL